MISSLAGGRLPVGSSARSAWVPHHAAHPTMLLAAEAGGKQVLLADDWKRRALGDQGCLRFLTSR